MLEYTGKYHVVKNNSQPVAYPTFVLRIDGTDLHALEALKAYASSVEQENPQLADELRFIISRARRAPITSQRELLVALRSR